MKRGKLGDAELAAAEAKLNIKAGKSVNAP